MRGNDDTEKANTAEELLHETLTKTGLYFLSDLHERQNSRTVRAALLRIPSDSYTVQAWVAAAAYILSDEPGTFASSKAAKNALLAALSIRA